MSLHDRIRSAAIAGSALISAAVHAIEESRRAAEIARLAWAVSDREKAEELHRMVYRVALAEALASPYVLGGQRIQQYLEALHGMAERVEPMPQTDDALRMMPEAVRWRAQDLARAMGVVVE